MSKNKSQGVVTAMDYKPKSAMSLEGKHAGATKGHQIGKSQKYIVTAKKNRHSMNSDASHSAGFDIENIAVHQDPDSYSGPDKKAANNQREGSKVA